MPRRRSSSRGSISRGHHLTAFPPTPFSSANAVGLLTKTADELGVSTISDLRAVEGPGLAGSPECRQRTDCLAGLEKNYGLEFKEFTPVDIELRYEVLDKGDADLSILFTTEPKLFDSDATWSSRTTGACCRPETCFSSPVNRRRGGRARLNEGRESSRRSSRSR